MNTSTILLATRQRAPFRFTDKMLSSFWGIEDNYQYHVRAFVDYAREAQGENVLDVLGAYYQELNQSNLSASTIACRRAAVKNRLRYIMQDVDERTLAAFEHELGKLDRDAATKAPGRSKAAVGADRVVSPTEYETIMRAARSDRQKRFIEFLYCTGCRISEATGVTLADCTPRGNVVTIRIRGKGNARQAYKERDVFISLAMFDRIRGTFGGSIYLFETGNGRRYSRCYVSNQLGKLTAQVLGRRIGAHGFRHSFATRKIRETGRVGAVSAYLGHSDIALTLRLYTHDVFSPVDVLGPEAVAL